MAIESLAQQASVFVDSLTVKAADTDEAVEQTAEEARIPDQGDTVTISEEARALVAIEASGESGEAKEGSDADQAIQTLKDRIEKLEEELKELEDSDLPEKTKMSQIQDKEMQLMELRDQLTKAEQEGAQASGQASGGGTRAQGAGNSVASF